MRVGALALLAACGGGGSTVDGPMHDGTNATVVMVDCNSTAAAATVTMNDMVDAYMPMASTIAMGQVVKFVTSATHNVEPNTSAAMTDPGLSVGFSQTKCLRFTA